MSKTEDYPIEVQVLDEDRRNRSAYVASIFSSQIRQSIERTHSKQLVCGLDPFRNRACTGAPNGSVPQNICSSGTFLLAGRCGRNNSPWKESVARKKIIQGVRGDLKSRIAATGHLYGLLTTQDLNCAL